MEYLEKRISDPALSALLSLNRVECGRLAELLSEKGKGNFLYVTQALDAIESGQINPHDPDSFPDGLVGMYHTFFERQFPDGRGFQEIRPNFDVIIAAREPLTAKQIGAFLKRSSFEIEKRWRGLPPISLSGRGNTPYITNRQLTDTPLWNPGRENEIISCLRLLHFPGNQRAVA